MAAICGVILAGGLSSRMGGGDKALLALGGQTVLAHVVARLLPQVSGVAINANGDPSRFAGFGLPVIADTIKGHPGPLAGIVAAMDWAVERGADHVVTVAGDTPFFPANLVARLADSLAPGAQIAMAESGGRRHPVFALWPAALRTDLHRHLEPGGSGSVAAFADRHGAATCAFPLGEADPFFNINTQAELAEASRMLRAAS